MAASVAPIFMQYALKEGLLLVSVNGTRRTLHALSGGGGGSTANPANSLTNNVFMQCAKATASGPGHQHGGPLPTGRYRVARLGRNGRISRSSYLHPLSAATMCGRTEMLIHGRGPHGSDGCIVPRSRADWAWLQGHLQNHPIAGRWVGELVVVESCMSSALV